MTIFKLEKERFDHERVGNQLFFVKNKVLMIEDLTNMESLPQANLELDGKQVLMNQPNSLNYNHFDPYNHNILLNYHGEDELSILVVLNKSLDKNTNVVQRKIESSKGAVFISKEKICVLSKTKHLFIYLFDGRNKKIDWTFKNPIQKIFQATVGKILIKSGNDVLLFDIASKSIVNEVQFANITRVFWSDNLSYVALFSKNQIMICTKTLEPLCKVKETSKLKSGCFDNENGFIYSTYSHIKYLIVPNKVPESASEVKNVSGIFKATKDPVYVSGYVNRNVFFIDRKGKVCREQVNTAEYELKVALNRKKINEVIKILKRGQLSGNSVIQYLKEEKCADIALLFEKDPEERFSLSISSGNIQEAYTNAVQIKEKDTYIQLGEQSLLQGYMNVAEKSYQSIKAFNKLSFFYANQGCTSKLKKLQTIVMNENNKNDIFENTLLLGNVRDRVKLLMQSNQIALAYACAKSHNLEDLIPLIEEEMQNREISLIGDFSEQLAERTQKAKSLLPCRPVFIEDEEFTCANWPHTMLIESNIQEQMNEDHIDEQEFYDAKSSEEDPARKPPSLDPNSKTELDDDGEGYSAGGMKAVGKPEVNDDIDDVDIMGDLGEDDLMGGLEDLADLDKELEEEIDIDNFEEQKKTEDPLKEMVKNSIIPVHHIAVGDFGKALELLQKQIGLENPEPLREIFEYIHSNLKVNLDSLPMFPSIKAILRGTDGNYNTGVITIDHLKKLYKEGLNETTKGNFQNALNAFQKCLHYSVLSLASTKEEELEIKKLISS